MNNTIHDTGRGTVTEKSPAVFSMAVSNSNSIQFSGALNSNHPGFFITVNNRPFHNLRIIGIYTYESDIFINQEGFLK